MPSVNDVYGSYINADDLVPTGIETIIDGVYVERVGDKEKIIAVLAGQKKHWVVNRTNAELLAEAYGDDYTLWAGQRVNLHRGRTSYMGKPVACVSLSVPAPEKGGTIDEARR